MALANSVVETVLKSPAHRLLSGRYVQLRFLQDGQPDAEQTHPIRYADTHHGIVVLVEDPATESWWRNFTTMGQTQVLFAGSWVPMTAHALVGSEDPAAVTPLLRSYAAQHPNVTSSLEGDTLEERVDHAVVVWLRPAA
jgi:hypothetical protein